MERTINDIAKESEEQGSDSQWKPEEGCSTCGNPVEPAYAWTEYETYGFVFCSESCMREFEQIGK